MWARREERCCAASLLCSERGQATCLEVQPKCEAAQPCAFGLDDESSRSVLRKEHIFDHTVGNLLPG